MMDNEKIRVTIRQMRALVHDGRERICALRPAWSVHLADETMCRLHEAIDSLEAAIGPGPNDRDDPASPPPAGRKESGTVR